MNTGEEGMALLQWQIQQGVKRYQAALSHSLKMTNYFDELRNINKLKFKLVDLRRMSWGKKMDINVNKEDAVLLIKVLRLGYKAMQDEKTIVLPNGAKAKVNDALLERALRVSATVITQLTLGIGDEKGQ